MGVSGFWSLIKGVPKKFQNHLDLGRIIDDNDIIIIDGSCVLKICWIVLTLGPEYFMADNVRKY